MKDTLIVKKATPLGARVWTSLLVFGFIGQIAWMVENVYFSTYIQKNITAAGWATSATVAASAIAAALATIFSAAWSDRVGKRRAFVCWGYILWGITTAAFALFGNGQVGGDVGLAVTLFVVMDCVMSAIGSTANDSAFSAWVTDVTDVTNRGVVDIVLSIMPILALIVIFAGFDGMTVHGNWTGFFLVLGGLTSAAGVLGLCIFRLCHYDTVYRVCLRKIRFHLPMLKQVIHFGLPSGVQNSVIGFANVIVQSNINSFGKVAMAAYGAYSKLEGFAFLPVTSFTMALTTFVGQNLGAGLHDRAKKGSRFGIIASVVIAEIIGVTMYLLAPQLVALFSPTPEVVELGTHQMRTTALFFCLLAYSHAIASICRGAGKAFVPMVIMLLFWCVVRITYITIVMRIIHEIQYIYMAYPITWSLSSIVYFLYYHFSDWVHGFEKKPAKS